MLTLFFFSHVALLHKKLTISNNYYPYFVNDVSAVLELISLDADALPHSHALRLVDKE